LFRNIHFTILLLKIVAAFYDKAGTFKARLFYKFWLYQKVKFDFNADLIGIGDRSGQIESGARDGHMSLFSSNQTLPTSLQAQPNPTHQPMIPAHGPTQTTHLTAKQIKTSVFNSAVAQ